jgi:signal peptidase
MKKAFKYLYVTILSVIAIFALIVILSTSNFFGHQAYVVKTGSMSPKIPAGSIVFDTKGGNYGIGDAITFISPGTPIVTNTDNLVTHRIVTIKQIGTLTYYRVKGDANKLPDPNLVPKDNVVGKVRFSIPKVGYLVAFIKSLPGIVIFIIIPATIVVYEEMRKIKDEIIRIREEAKEIEKDVTKESKRIKKLMAKLKSRIMAKPGMTGTAKKMVTKSKIEIKQTKKKLS